MRHAVEGNYDVLRDWYSNHISETAIAHIVEVLQLKDESGKPLRLGDFAYLAASTATLALTPAITRHKPARKADCLKSIKVMLERESAG